MRCKECLNIVKHPTKKTKMLQICGKCRDLKTGIKYSTMSHFAIQYTVKSCLDQDHVVNSAWLAGSASSEAW